MQATDKELGKLHAQIAKAFSTSIDNTEQASVLLNEHKDDLPEAVVAFLERVSTPNPSLMAAAVKFLKDNGITCVVQDDEQMTELEQKLRSKRRLSDVPVEELH